MKAGRSLQDLALEIERRRALKYDVVANTATLTALGGDELHIPATSTRPDMRTEFVMDRRFHTQVAEHLGLPMKVYDHLKADHEPLYLNLVNGLLRDHPKARLVRTLDGQARAFLSNRYRVIDNETLVEMALPTLQEFPGFEIASAQITDAKMYIKVVFPWQKAAIGILERGGHYGLRPGDPNTVRGGLVIQNSEVGEGSVGVYPFTEVLVCSNGMTHMDFGTRRFHTGARLADTEETYAYYADDTIRASNEALKLQVRDLVRAAASDVVFEQIVSQMRESTERRIEGDPIKAVEQVQVSFGFTDTEKGSVLSALIQGGDLSQWGLVNAVTRAASDLEDYDRASQFEEVGGKLLAYDDADWRKVAVAA